MGQVVSLPIPHQRSGEFVPSGPYAIETNGLPIYRTHVREWNTIDHEEHQEGNVFVESVVMNDGITYEVNIGEPEEPKTDVPVVFTTAWFTGTGGPNKLTMLKLMKAGFPAVLVGPEDPQYTPQSWHAPKSYPLGYTAHNMHQMLWALGPSYNFDPSRILVTGQSRAAMIGMCINAMAVEHDREIVHTVAVAPCYPKAFRLADVPGFVEQVSHEPTALAKSVTDTPLNELRHLWHTYPFEAGVGHFLQNIMQTKVLFGGESGQYAGQIPKDTTMDVLTFKHDRSSKINEWRKIFAEHSGVTVEELPGAHLTMPSSVPRVIDILTQHREALHL